nr:hypothetical protein [Tanacetum cinerariifolium]
MTPSIIATITTSSESPIPPPTISSIILKNLPTFNSAFRFDERLRSLETSFSEYRQTNPFVDAVSAIPADLSEMELKKILIEKMEGNKSIQRSEEQQNLYKVLVEAYDADKAILDTYGESTILKRRREDDDQEGPSTGLDRGSKRQKKGDLKLGVESYQKKLNLTKPDTYRTDLRRREAYTAYSNPRGFIYRNKDKKNKLMRIDGLHKFSDGTLNDVRNALDDRLKGIRMQYLPSTIWRKGNKDRAAAMIQAIEKILKTRRIMRSLEKFVGGRLIEESVNATLEAEVLTRSSHSSRTSYAIAADLSEIELKKILIKKMEGNKSIQRSDEQQNLYKALVEAYDADKAILDTYGESTILKRRREDDDQEGPSAGSDRGSKRQKEGGEHASASTPSETETEGAGRTTTGSQSRELSVSESAFAEEPVQTTCQMEEPPHPVFEIGVDDQPIQPIDYNRHALWGVSHWGWKRHQFYGYAVNRESALDVYSKRRIIAVTELKIVEWHDYKHLDWISVRRDDDQIYKFKEGDFKRLRLQDIEDMLLLLEHCHPEASGRSSTGSGKLPEEAQPYESRHVPTRSEAT